MTKVPLAESATVDCVKIRDYLLNGAHPQNGGKAAFFRAFGYSAEAWPGLQAALGRHVVDNDVISVEGSLYGTKYAVACRLHTPDGRNPCVTSVWIVEPGSEPRFVTAYP